MTNSTSPASQLKLPANIPAPPPTNEPRHQHKNWIWCEYDLRKKYTAGDEFKTLLKDLKNPVDVTEIEFTREREKA
jgi:hypothetical protein